MENDAIYSVNRLYLEHLRGKLRPTAIVLPPEMWEQLQRHVMARMPDGEKMLFADPEKEIRLHFLYLATPIVCGDENTQPHAEGGYQSGREA